MRNNFAECMTQLALNNERLVLLYGDSGNRLFNPFKEFADDRCINVGIAEANMISVAAGMAMNGLQPVTYAITPFTSSRCYEQIKVDVAYQNLPVVIVGTGSGLAYANLGPTHHSFEDIAIMRALPNMQIVCPCDSKELKALLPQILESGKPTYFRIGKKREPLLLPNEAEVKLGIPTQIRSGKDVAILSCGAITKVALDLVDTLTEKGISAELVSFHTVKPLNEDYLKSLAERFSHIVAIEEHGLVGGLGSALLEFYNENGIAARITRCGIPDRFIDKLANQKSGWEAAELTVTAILKKIGY